MFRKIYVLVLLLLLGVSTYGQKSGLNARMALSVNAVDLGWFLTPNLGMQYAVGRHWTVKAEVKYNRWTFNDGSADSRVRHARQEYSLGGRWWGWYTYTGWWIGLSAKYREYSGCGLSSLNPGSWGDRYVKEEGDAVGAALSFGYSVQITEWLDIDFGLGIWGGNAWYRQYSGEADGSGNVCPRYGKRTDASVDAPASHTLFIAPDEVMVTAVFIF